MIRFAEGRQADGLARLQERFPGLVSAPLAQDDIVNLRRLESWPAVLAGLTLLMAGAAFLHALVTSVRAQRHALAVVKALGWSRAQVGRSVFWHASFLALPAILIGVPAGVVLGRWGWGMVARSLGVPSAPVIPILALVVIAAVALVAANLLAVWPSWRAAHTSAVDALRTE
jgi:ABC-type lipoprotein release transport system permease subunit